MLKIYYARPISGCSPQTVFDEYENAIRLFDGATVLTARACNVPLRFVRDKLPSGARFHPATSDHAIVKRDYWMVNQADLVYVDLLFAKKVSIGCMMELAWAHQLGKHTVVVLEKDNIHDHAFVLETADMRFTSGGQAIKYVQNMIQVYKKPPLVPDGAVFRIEKDGS
jgi:nucleoside 2-deoxyribosyltransferase